MQKRKRVSLRTRLAAALTALLLASCGGGGGNPGICLGSTQVCNPGSSSGSATGAAGGNGSGILSPDIPSETVAGICTAASEKQFVRSYLNEAYLWTDEIGTVDATPYTAAGYFYQLLVTTPDTHGLPKDRFSYVLTRTNADSLTSGASLGYGVDWVIDAQGRTRVAKVAAGSPADLAGLARGGELGSVVSASQNSWYPNTAGAFVTFNYRDAPGLPLRLIALTAAPLQENPVPLTSTVLSPQGRRVGYVLFNAHTAGAQDKLVSALSALNAGRVDDLVLDLRYNGGGYLYVALSLASMLASPASDGQVFERLQFNSKRTEASQANVTRFAGTVQYGEPQYPVGTALPRLGLPRVYVLTTGGTCSASESVINGLRGVNVEVVLVGATTCGKPYGFTRADNCSLAYYPIEFQGFNARDFGDYSTGFAATCPAADDLGHALGDPAEGLLGIALRHADTGACSPSTALALSQRAATAGAPQGLVLDIQRHRPGKLLP
ncbi:MAG: S41 family peptidase [Ramlibacter sp.]